MHHTDILIVGAGPVGLFGVFQAGMLGMKSHVIDVLDFTGGQCTALYNEKPIYDIPAYPSITAGGLIQKLEEQAKPFSPVYHLGQKAISCTKDGDNFFVTTSNNIVISTKAILIAAGNGAFTPNRPPIVGIEEYEDKSIFYNINNKRLFTDKKIVIAGGGDSAVDWAIELSSISDKVFLVHRRDKFRCSPHSLERLYKLSETDTITLVTPYQLDGLNGKDGKLEIVKVKDFNGKVMELEADFLLPFYGLKMDLGPLKDWGFNIDNLNHIKVDSSFYQTNINGIYAVGDIASYSGKLKLILTGFAEVASSLHHAYNRVFPGKALHFQYSTTKGI